MTLHLRPLNADQIAWALDLVQSPARAAAKPLAVREAVWHNLLSARAAGRLPISAAPVRATPDHGGHAA